MQKVTYRNPLGQEETALFLTYDEAVPFMQTQKSIISITEDLNLRTLEVFLILKAFQNQQYLTLECKSNKLGMHVKTLKRKIFAYSELAHLRSLYGINYQSI